MSEPLQLPGETARAALRHIENELFGGTATSGEQPPALTWEKIAALREDIRSVEIWFSPYFEAGKCAKIPLEHYGFAFLFNEAEFWQHTELVASCAEKSLPVYGPGYKRINPTTLTDSPVPYQVEEAT